MTLFNQLSTTTCHGVTQLSTFQSKLQQNLQGENTPAKFTIQLVLKSRTSDRPLEACIVVTRDFVRLEVLSVIRERAIDVWSAHQSSEQNTRIRI